MSEGVLSLFHYGPSVFCFLCFTEIPYLLSSDVFSVLCCFSVFVFTVILVLPCFYVILFFFFTVFCVPVCFPWFFFWGGGMFCCDPCVS